MLQAHKWYSMHALLDAVLASICEEYDEQAALYADQLVQMSECYICC
jgi:hypothetical protein